MKQFIIASLSFFIAATASAGIDFKPYTLRTFDGQAHEAEIGTLPVSGTIELSFIRIRSTATSPGSPVVFLSPGPGIASSVLGRVPVYFALFDRIRASADVILLDARGEGMSKPNLDDCASGPMPSQPFASEASLVAAYVASVSHCAAGWRARGIDLRDFTTAARADDVERLRRAIGATRVSIIAFSYGTEVAVSLLRRYPETIDRAALAATDAGAVNSRISPDILDAQLYKLGLLADLDLRASISRLLLEFNKRPREITIRDAKGVSHKMRIGKAALQLLVAAKLADAGGAAILPALVDSLTHDDQSILEPLAQRFAAGFQTGMTLVGRAIDCSTPTSEAARTSEEHMPVLGDVRNTYLDPRVCAAIVPGRPKRNANFAALLSNVPVLFISGTLDPNAPPFFTEQLRLGMPQSRHVIVINGFHETLPSSEVQKVVVAFLRGDEIGSPVIDFERPKFLSIEEARIAVARSR
jgi:pimeloyl-ACP methyl ester carboxylesterase